MRMYTTVELARFIEHDIHHELNMRRVERTASFRFMPVFELYQSIVNSVYGSHVTAGFFNKILSDLRKTGVVVAQDGGKSLALTEAAWTIQNKYNEQRDQFEELVDDLLDHGVFSDVRALAKYLQVSKVPLGAEVRFYDGPAETCSALGYPIVEDRFLELAIPLLQAKVGGAQ